MLALVWFAPGRLYRADAVIDVARVMQKMSRLLVSRELFHVN
jgi:hypothetical protein